jgi:phosphonate degradation associated HDIG domain protein
MEAIRRSDDVVDGVLRLLTIGQRSSYERTVQDAPTESVTQLEHALQCARLAELEGASEPVVAAALLHDIGHLLLEADRPQSSASRSDLRHEQVGARYLERRFRPEVAAPVRLHVAAKRYLCTVEPEYEATLSPASQFTLRLQGGLLDQEDVAAFAGQTGARDAVALRRWDDHAKTPGQPTRSLDEYRPLLQSLMHR